MVYPPVRWLDSWRLRLCIEVCTSKQDQPVDRKKRDLVSEVVPESAITLSPTSQPHPDAEAQLKVDTRLLGRQPGSMRQFETEVDAPDQLSSPVIGVPVGVKIQLDVRLEAVMEGVLVTGTVRGPLHGECARCLASIEDTANAEFQELFHYPDEDGASGAVNDAPTGTEQDEEEDYYYLEGDWVDLEPLVRDAIVLALPLSPLCRQDCPGLCAECGARLAEVGPEHRHEERIDPRWAELRSIHPRTGE